MGVMMAPVEGSGSCPAWMQSVAKPMYLHLIEATNNGCARSGIHSRGARGGPRGCGAAPPCSKILEYPLAQVSLEAVGQDGDHGGPRAHLARHLTGREGRRPRRPA